MQGNIYFIRGVHGFVKVGYATDIQKRVAQLQTGHPVELHILAAIPGTMRLEKAFHTALIAYQSSGEWFRMKPQVRKLVRLIQAGARPKTAADIQMLLVFNPKDGFGRGINADFKKVDTEF